MSSSDPRLDALARSHRRRADPTAEVGVIVVGLVVSGSIALWAMVQLGMVPITGVLVASSVLAAACGIEVLRGLGAPQPQAAEDPVQVLVDARRVALRAELDRWTRPTSWLIALAGSFLVVSAGLVVLPGLSFVPQMLGTAFLASVLIASVTYLMWGLVVRVPNIRRDLSAMGEEAPQM